MDTDRPLVTAAPSAEVMEALRELYDDEGVSIWLDHWRNSDRTTRERLEQSIHAMTDGAYL